MKVNTMQNGPFVEYSLNNNVLTFHGENDLAINLSEKQKKFDVVIDIILEGGLLKEFKDKRSNKIKTVASVVIPCAEFYTAPYTVTNNDTTYKPQLKKPINTDLVILKLWNYELSNINLI